MTSGVVARRYATAVFALAQAAGKIDRIDTDLRGIADALAMQAEVRRFFVSPVVNRTFKASMLERAFKGRVDGISLNALLLLVRKRREALLPSVTHEYRKFVLAEKKREPLEIVSARAPEPGEIERMVARLSQVYDKQFEVRTSFDPALLGGVQLKMGDRYIDGSISGRLDELARELFAKQ